MSDFKLADFIKKADEIIVIEDKELGTIRIKTLTQYDNDELKRLHEKDGGELVLLETWKMLSKVDPSATMDDLKRMGVDKMVALAALTHQHLDFRDLRKEAEQVKLETSGP